MKGGVQQRTCEGEGRERGDKLNFAPRGRKQRQTGEEGKKTQKEGTQDRHSERGRERERGGRKETRRERKEKQLHSEMQIPFGCE